MLLYPWVAGHYFGDSPVHAGVFLGTAIHDTSQVIGSALIYSQQAGAPDALSAASVAKLLRNLSIVVLIPLAAWVTQRADSGAAADDAADQSSPTPGSQSRADGAPLRSPSSRAVPFFVFAFILFVIIRTAGDAMFQADGPMWHAVVSAGQSASELFLVCGMTAVGLSVSFTDMWRIGWRPLAAGFLVATLVGAQPHPDIGCASLLRLKKPAGGTQPGATGKRTLHLMQRREPDGHPLNAWLYIQGAPENRCGCCDGTHCTNKSEISCEATRVVLCPLGGARESRSMPGR
jgi:hypothetical protein